MLPSLDEVLAAFPRKGLLVNVKSNDPAEGEALARRLSRLAPDRLDTVAVYGGHRPVSVVRERLPQVAAMSPASLKACLLRYVALGWSGYLPSACRRSIVLVPINVAPWLWGWPDRLLTRMRAASTAVFVIGPYTGGDFSTGIDTVEELSRLPRRPTLGVWTNRVDRIAPLVRSTPANRS